VNFSHQTHAVGLGYVEKKILRSLASASTAVQKYKISRLLANFDMLYYLTGACYKGARKEKKSIDPNGRPGRPELCHLVQPVQLFSDQGLWIKG
jgi:hypothetical protein